MGQFKTKWIQEAQRSIIRTRTGGNNFARKSKTSSPIVPCPSIQNNLVNEYLKTNKRKIVILSKEDWANSGQKIAEAIRNYTSYYAICITILPSPSFYPYSRDLVIGTTWNTSNKNWTLAKQIIEKAGIIHIKSNKSLGFSFANINLERRKPIIYTHGGSVYRANWKKINKETDYVAARTVLMPDLIHSPDTIFTPHPIDIIKVKPIPLNQKNSKLTLSHSPSNISFKKTHLLDSLKKDDRLNIDIITNTPYLRCLERKARSHIFYDRIQDSCNSYGNSAVEACALGLATISYWDKVYAPLLNNCPIVSCKENQLKVEIEKLINETSYRLEKGRQCREWVESFHGAHKIAKLFQKIYLELA